MSEGEYVESLISEYQTLLGEKLLKNSQGQYDDSGMLKELSVSADWTVTGARELLKLASNYGIHAAQCVGDCCGAPQRRWLGTILNRECDSYNKRSHVIPDRNFSKLFRRVTEAWTNY
jgi:hypothetical protein